VTTCREVIDFEGRAGLAYIGRAYKRHNRAAATVDRRHSCAQEFAYGRVGTPPRSSARPPGGGGASAAETDPARGPGRIAFRAWVVKSPARTLTRAIRREPGIPVRVSRQLPALALCFFELEEALCGGGYEVTTS